MKSRLDTITMKSAVASDPLLMEETSPHYIEFRNVYKAFDHPVLVDVSFHVDAGRCLAIIGRSGVGKSVALAHIMGFLKPDSGRIFVGGQDITDYDETRLRKVRERVTMVFQSGALFDSLTARENIEFSLESRSGKLLQNADEIVEKLLDQVGIRAYAGMYPAELAVGVKRAVAIARALAAEPEAVLYDEPTTMVDPHMSVHMTDLIARLNRQLKLTSVVVTHDLELMRHTADNVVFLHEGRVIYFGSVAEMERSDHPHIREFLARDRLEVA